MSTLSTFVVSLGIAWGLMVSLASAQDIRWLDVPRIQFETSAVEQEEPPVVVPLPPLPRPATPPPLFPPSTVARDADPLLLQAAEHPTQEGADAWLDWKLKRLANVRQFDFYLRESLKKRRLQP